MLALFAFVKSTYSNFPWLAAVFAVQMWQTGSTAQSVCVLNVEILVMVTSNESAHGLFGVTIFCDLRKKY